MRATTYNTTVQSESDWPIEWDRAWTAMYQQLRGDWPMDTKCVRFIGLCAAIRDGMLMNGARPGQDTYTIEIGQRLIQNAYDELIWDEAERAELHYRILACRQYIMNEVPDEWKIKSQDSAVRDTDTDDDSGPAIWGPALPPDDNN